MNINEKIAKIEAKYLYLLTKKLIEMNKLMIIINTNNVLHIKLLQYTRIAFIFMSKYENKIDKKIKYMHKTMLLSIK